MRMSDLITREIIRMLNESEENTAEIQRNEFAGLIGCAPSQINYVLSSRFTPEHGYIIESRRGGGGYIRIKRIPKDIFGDIEEIIRKIDTGISKEKAKGIIDYLSDTDRLDKKQKTIIETVVLEALDEGEDEIRARILKQILVKM